MFTSDDVVEQYGVAKGSYDEIALPRINAHTVRRAGRRPRCMPCLDTDVPPRRALVSVRAADRLLPPTPSLCPAAVCPLPCPPQVRCLQAGPPAEVLEVGQEPIARVLEWGEVLLSVRYAPINPADL